MLLGTQGIGIVWGAGQGLQDASERDNAEEEGGACTQGGCSVSKQGSMYMLVPQGIPEVHKHSFLFPSS